jgi:Ca-activated chloride channel family protein
MTRGWRLERALKAQLGMNRPWLLPITLCALAGAAPAGASPEPEAGALLARGADGTTHPFPLVHTSVFADVAGPIARVTVTQHFDNPHEEAVEAVYVFPLPAKSAVAHFEVRAGGRVVKGVLQRRDQARATYESARSEGKTAALLDQERPNLFTLSVANLVPHEQVQVSLQYVDLLEYADGGYRFVYPMTVGPRFNPGAPLAGVSQGHGTWPDTTVVPDASRISPPLAEAGRSGRDIDVTLKIDAGVPLVSLASSTHRMKVERASSRQAVLRLAEEDRIPNKDLVVDIQVAGQELQTGVIATRPDPAAPGHVLMILQPKADADVRTEVTPKEMVFVLDTSCSMSGQPIEAAKAVMRAAVRGMNPEDAFQIFGFDSEVSTLSKDGPVPASEENIQRGLAFIDAFQGGGGTYMNAGITAALQPPEDPKRMRMVFFMTDGYIGNEDQIFRQIDADRKNARLFAFGVGSSVNRHLVEGMAERGRGFSEIVGYATDPHDVAGRFYERIRKPVLTDVQVSFEGVEVQDVLPTALPDLYEAQPLVLVGRYTQAGAGRVRVEGKVRGQPRRWSVPVELPAVAPEHAQVAQLWGRRQIHDLERHAAAADAAAEPITQVALQYGLVSAYTSFVAVLHEVKVDPADATRTVMVPSELPEGMAPAMVGAGLSRTEIPPGDPIITVHAPKDAQRVTAYFPFGLVKPLHYDRVTNTWRARFLVPKPWTGTRASGARSGPEAREDGWDGSAGPGPEGWYGVQVHVLGRDGVTRVLDVPYHLDATGPDLLVELDRRLVDRGDLIAIRVDAVEPTKEVSVYAAPFGELQHLLEPMDETETRFGGDLLVPDDAPLGWFELVVVARDKAGNRTEQRLELMVVE